MSGAVVISTPSALPTTTDVAIRMHPGGVVFLAVIALYGTIGNIFIIGAVSLQPKLRVRGNVFVVNLAVADLIICCYLMPLSLVSSQYDEEPFGDWLCDLNGFLLMTCCGVSTQTLMLIAIERYCHVCKVTFYRRFFTPTLIAVYITIVWVYTAIWTCQGLTGWSRFVYGNDVWLCVVDASFSLSYNICLVFFGMILPMIVLSFCYFMIFRMVYKTRKRLKNHRKKLAQKPNSRKSKSEERKEKKEFRLIVMLFTIVIVFVVFWTPAAIVMSFSAPWKSMPDILYTIAIWFALTNSSFNSIIYGAMNQNFRVGYLMFFNKIFCACAGPDNKVTCNSCKIFKKKDKDDSTSVSQTGGTSNANITDNTQTGSTGNSTAKSPKQMTPAEPEHQSVIINGELVTYRKNTKLVGSRPSTAKSMRTEVTIRSDSKISLRSQTSIGSMGEDFISVEGGTVHQSALIRALNDHVDMALEKITGEDEDEEEEEQTKHNNNDSAKNNNDTVTTTKTKPPISARRTKSASNKTMSSRESTTLSQSTMKPARAMNNRTAPMDTRNASPHSSQVLLRQETMTPIIEYEI